MKFRSSEDSPRQRPHQIPVGGERAVKKARGARGAGEANRLTTTERYQVINTIFQMFHLMNLVRKLCEIAGVSRNCYCAWLKRAELGSFREERDYAEYLLLKWIHDRRHGKIGYSGLNVEVLDLVG